jgi:hypothetical protein
MAIKPIIARDKLIRMSADISATPIIEDPRLMTMTDVAARPRKIGGKVELMDPNGKAAAGSGGTRMKPAPSKAEASSGKPGKDQEGLAAEPANGPASVRLRLRIDRGNVTLVGAHAVPGEMPATERLDYGLAYEITNGTRRVAAGSIPDVGTKRSFPDPDGRAGMQGHHLTPLESFEVNVRMPQREFSQAALPKLRIMLFRMKDQTAGIPITGAPIGAQYAEQLRPVAELRGIDFKQLPEGLQAQVRTAASAKVTE